MQSNSKMHNCLETSKEKITLGTYVRKKSEPRIHISILQHMCLFSKGKKKFGTLAIIDAHRVATKCQDNSTT